MYCFLQRQNWHICIWSVQTKYHHGTVTAWYQYKSLYSGSATIHLQMHLHDQPIDTISSVKVRVPECEHVPLDLQELFLDGQKLENSLTIRECGVTSNGMLNLVVDQGRNTQIFVALHTGETLSKCMGKPRRNSLEAQGVDLRQKGYPSGYPDLLCTSSTRQWAHPELLHYWEQPHAPPRDINSSHPPAIGEDAERKGA